MNMETQQSGVKGPVAAKQGALHRLLQRLTAILLVPLSLWFMASMATLSSIDYTVITTWITTPVTSALLILFVLSLFFHAQLGLQIVIEDHIRSQWQKVANIFLVRLIALIAASASIYTIVRIYLFFNS